MTDTWDAFQAKARYAEMIAEHMLGLYRRNEPVLSAPVTQMVHGMNDLEIWTVLVGYLCSVAVSAERAASNAHGPLATAAEQGIPVVPVEQTPWVVGVRDQMEAAAKAGDREGFAQTSVEGLLRAAKIDFPDGDIPLDLMLRYCLQFDQKMLTLVASEALRRLFNERKT